jgi:hypothetical protein
VWVDGWQHACCGEDFAVGDRVTWTVTYELDTPWAATVLGAAEAARITAAEEHHGDETGTLTGTVTGIESVRCRYARGADGALHPVPGSGVRQARRAVPDVGPPDEPAARSPAPASRASRGRRRPPPATRERSSAGSSTSRT